MALEDWQVEFLDSLPNIQGMSAEDTRSLLAKLAFDEEVGEWRAIVVRLNSASDAELKIRYLDLGIAYGRARALAAQRAAASPDGDDVATGDDEHPDFEAFSAMAEQILRTPNVRTLHGYTQASLLNAIQRAAEVAETPEDIRLLADAYLTLPSPDEDSLDND